MPLNPVKLAFPPGLFRSGTLYETIGRWYDAAWVRFFEKAIRPVGGFQTLAVTGATIAHDAFAGTVGTAITAHTPDLLFGGWVEPGGAVYELNGSGAVFNASSGPVVDTGAWCTVDILADDFSAAWTFSHGSSDEGCVAYINTNSAHTEYTQFQVGSIGSNVYAVVYGSGADAGILGGSFSWPNSQNLILTVESRNGTLTVSYSVNAGPTTSLGSFTPTVKLNTSTHRRFGFEVDGKIGGAGDVLLLDLTVAENVQAYPRSLLGWRKTSGQAYLMVGTTNDLFAFTQGQLSKVTPAAGLVAGYVSTTLGTGAYGTGNYGAGAYGTGDPTQTTELEASTWQMDVMPLDAGDVTVAVRTSDGTLWVWDPATAAAVAATGSAPVNNTGVVVTPEQFLVALGAGGASRVVQWADQSSTSTWTPSSSNQAGNFTIAGSGQLMCGRRGRNETLLWTDTGLWAMRFIGGTLVYSFDELGSGCGIISRQAVTMIEAGKAVWMGQNRFFRYEGFVQPIPCEVADKVFGDINLIQRHKIVSFSVAQFAEVWWLYCSAASDEPDRYVTWNYAENHWAFGPLTRTAGVDRGAFAYPIMADQTGLLYQHENGTTHTGISPYLESGPFELSEDPDRVFDVVRVMPDEKTLGDVQVKLISSYFPTGTETTSAAFTAANPTDVRVNARLVRLRLDEHVVGNWRIGQFRVNVLPQGQR